MMMMMNEGLPYPTSLLGTQGSFSATPAMTSRRTFSSRDAQLHRELENTILSHKQAPRGVMAQIHADPLKKTRYNQALWNTAASFLLMIFAAQTLKSSKDKQKAQEAMTHLEQELHENRRKIKHALQESTYRHMATQVLEATTTTSATSTHSFWWKKVNTSSTLQENQIVVASQVLERELQNLLGEASWDDTERDKHHLEQLFQETPEVAIPLMTGEEQQDNENVTVITKRIFSI